MTPDVEKNDLHQETDMLRSIVEGKCGSVPVASSSELHRRCPYENRKPMNDVTSTGRLRADGSISERAACSPSASATFWPSNQYWIFIPKLGRMFDVSELQTAYLK